MPDLSTLILLAIAVLLLVLVIRILRLPIKLFFKFLIHAAAGFAMLFVVNFLGGFFNVSLEVSWVSCATAGILGVPGIIILLVFKYLL